MRFLYSQLLRLAVPIMLVRLLWRSRKNAGYRLKMLQRLAYGLPAHSPKRASPVWIHAVSVGETLAIAPLIEMLLTRHPKIPLLLTSTTPTGAAQVARLFGDRVDHCWMPFDTPGAVSRFLYHFQPRAIAMVETEIWPNLVHQASEQGRPLYLLNGRLSARSARGYSRVAWLSRPMMAALDVVAAQHRADAQRFQAVGVRPDAIQVVGSVKYDIDLARLTVDCGAIRDQLGSELVDRRVFVAASTHPGEELQVVAAFKRLLQRVPNALLVLAPRHVERTDDLINQNLAGDLPQQRRSANEPLASDTRIIFWDTLGELGAVMGLAEAVFVGGSLVKHGGHNPLEAAVWGVPVLTGPHTFNFAATYRELIGVGAAQEVTTEGMLAKQLIALATSADEARRRGLAGRRVVESNRGALERQFALVSAYLD